MRTVLILPGTLTLQAEWGSAASWGTGRYTPCAHAPAQSQKLPPSPAQTPGDGAAALAWRHHPPDGDPAAPQVTISESLWPRRVLGFEPSKGTREVTIPLPQPLLLTPPRRMLSTFQSLLPTHHLKSNYPVHSAHQGTSSLDHSEMDKQVPRTEAASRPEPEAQSL